MSLDVDRAYELDHGIIINNAQYIASGDASPIGTSAPLNTIYYQSNGDVFRKTGLGVSDWSVVPMTGASSSEVITAYGSSQALSTTQSILNFPNVPLNTGSFTYSNGEITFSDSGTYFIAIGLSLDPATQSDIRTGLEVVVEIDNGGGYGVIPYATSNTYARDTDATTSSLFVPITIAAGSKLRVQVSLSLGTGNLIANKSSLTVFLPKGEKGSTGEQGEQGATGASGVNGADGTDAAEIISAEFIGNDMKFNKDDATFFLIPEARESLKGNDGQDGVSFFRNEYVFDNQTSLTINHGQGKAPIIIAHEANITFESKKFNSFKFNSKRFGAGFSISGLAYIPENGYTRVDDNGFNSITITFPLAKSGIISLIA
jgi:hypothetical protein